MTTTFPIFLPPLAVGNLSRDCPRPAPPINVDCFSQSFPPQPKCDPESPAASKEELENFEKLVTEEKYSVFQAQAYEIKQLRRKIRKHDQKSCCNELEATLRQAQRILQSSKTELADQGYLINNLLQAIKKSRLLPGSLPYNRICTVVRSSLNPKLEKGGMSRKEEIEYSKVPNNQEVMKALLGQSVPDAVPEDEIDHYLKTQAEILKGMSYNQFVNSMRLAKQGSI